MAPVVHGLQDEYWGRVEFVYVQQEDPANSDLKQRLGFRYRPHFFLIDAEGNTVEQWLGSVLREDFVLAFEEILGQ